MFGIDSSEFLVIGLVALLVIGPKDLPRVMRLVGGWVGRGRAMTRHLRAGFDTMMREAELEEMQKQWAKQNAEIMAATDPAAVGPHAYEAPPAAYDPAAAPHAADAVVADHPYDHPGALPVAEPSQTSDGHSRESGDPMSGSATSGPRFRGDDTLDNSGFPTMTGPQPSPRALAAADAPHEPAVTPP